MGNTWFKKEKISNVTLLEGKADDLKSIPDKSFDIVFTDAVLIFVGPDKIERVVKELTRIAKKGIILVEWHSIDRNEKGLGYYYKGMYIRNYENLLKRFLKNVKIDINKINKNIWPDKNWQEVGTFIEVKL